MTDQRGKSGFSYLACVSVTVRIIIFVFKAAIILVGATDRHYGSYKYNSFCYRFEFLKMCQKLNDFKDLIEFPFFMSLVR